MYNSWSLKHLQIFTILWWDNQASQMEGPRPPSFTPPSTWKAAVATPQIKFFGKGRQSYTSNATDKVGRFSDLTKLANCGRFCPPTEASPPAPPLPDSLSLISLLPAPPCRPTASVLQHRGAAARGPLHAAPQRAAPRYGDATCESCNSRWWVVWPGHERGRHRSKLSKCCHEPSRNITVDGRGNFWLNHPSCYHGYMESSGCARLEIINKQVILNISYWNHQPGKPLPFWIFLVGRYITCSHAPSFFTHIPCLQDSHRRRLHRDAGRRLHDPIPLHWWLTKVW